MSEEVKILNQEFKQINLRGNKTKLLSLDEELKLKIILKRKINLYCYSFLSN